MTVREDVVVRLMEVANPAITEESEVLDASGNEVSSAIFTLARATIGACIGLGADPASLRRAVEQLLLDCAPPKAH